MIELRGKNIIIIGGSDGIGKATALKLANAGANIAVTGRTAEKSEAVAAAARTMGVTALSYALDVVVPENVDKVVDSAINELGSVDVMINNAGICELADVEHMTVDEWKRTIDINLNGMFYCCHAVIPQMKKQGYGKIINMASQAGKAGMANLAHYCASKAGVILFTRALALELAPYHITVNSICPGNVDTDMIKREAVTVNQNTGKSISEIEKEWNEVVPLGRYASPEEIADLYLFLSSKYSNYITGEDINITGGMTMY